MLTSFYLTDGINKAVADNKEFAKEITKAISKFSMKDWGDTCSEDKELNDMALVNGDRVVALYKTSKGKVFIITEADRNATTVLFASEY